MAHLGFQDMIPQADGAAEDASLAAHAETLQLTSPRSAPGASPSHRMPEANGNAFKEEGNHSLCCYCCSCCWNCRCTPMRMRILCQIMHGPGRTMSGCCSLSVQGHAPCVGG